MSSREKASGSGKESAVAVPGVRANSGHSSSKQEALLVQGAAQARAHVCALVQDLK